MVRLNLLVDSHAWLWATSAPDRLSPAARDAIEDGRNVPHLSVASIWEIAIKVSIGRLKIDEPLESLVARSVANVGYLVLDVQSAHALRVANLPRHHKDPFDRLLVAQALVEGLTLVTADPWLAKYGVEVLSA